jgi:hypothetical protein
LIYDSFGNGKTGPVFKPPQLQAVGNKGVNPLRLMKLACPAFQNPVSIGVLPIKISGITEKRYIESPFDSIAIKSRAEHVMPGHMAPRYKVAGFPCPVRNAIVPNLGAETLTAYCREAPHGEIHTKILAARRRYHNEQPQGKP